MIAEVTMWNSLGDTSGTTIRPTWGRLFDNLSVPVEFAGDMDHPGWSPATFAPCLRSAENVEMVSAMVLDYDGTSTIEAAAEVWAEYYGLIHTTRKHTPGAHRFRVILPLGRRVTPAEHAAMWPRIMELSGGKLDTQTKDASRFWFTPGTAKPQHFQALRLTGQPMDPDLILELPAAKPPQPKLALVPYRPNTAADAEKRASAYVAQMPAAISGSGGHQALWAATLAAVQGFGLGERAAFAILWSEYNPRCQPAWSEKDIWHKIRDAASKAKVSTGYKLDEQRDWNPQHYGSALNPAHVPIRGADPVSIGDAQDPGTGGEYDTHQVEQIEDVPTPTAVQHYGVRSIAEMLLGVFSRASQQKPERGAPCGVETIDRLIGGFRRGRVTVLGASTSWGKSSFAVMTSDVGLAAGRRILMVSGEDSEDTYGQRIMTRRCGINAMSLRDFEVTPKDLSRMASALGAAEQEPYFLNGIGKHAEYLATAIGAIAKERDIDLVIVDYLQAFTCGKRCQDRRNEITHIARVFTDAIKNSGAAGLIFSQLKRLEDGQRPTMHDLKESGDVENMAEHVLIGYAQTPKGGAVTDKKRWLLIEKNKDGPVIGEPIEMTFDTVTASFRGQRSDDY